MNSSLLRYSSCSRKKALTFSEKEEDLIKSKENNQFQVYAVLTLSISFRARVAFGAENRFFKALALSHS